jgi:hypothetical protein
VGLQGVIELPMMHPAESVVLTRTISTATLGVPVESGVWMLTIGSYSAAYSVHTKKSGVMLAYYTRAGETLVFSFPGDVATPRSHNRIY